RLCVPSWCSRLLRQLLLPLPGVTESVGGGILGLPSESCVYSGGVGVNLHYVAGASAANGVIELYACYFLELINKLHHRHSLTRSQVESFIDFSIGEAVQIFHRLYVSVGQVYDVDEVTDIRTIGRVIVVAENRELFALARRGLCDVGDQVIRHANRQFAHKRTGVRT